MWTIAEPTFDSAEPAEEWSAQQAFRGDEKSDLVHLFQCSNLFNSHYGFSLGRYRDRDGSQHRRRPGGHRGHFTGTLTHALPMPQCVKAGQEQQG